MKYCFTIVLYIKLINSSWAQIDNGLIYLPNSCPGETIEKKIFITDYNFENEKTTFLFKRSTIPGLKAYYEGVELDSLTEIVFPPNDLQILVKFNVPENIQVSKIFYSIKKNGKLQNNYISILLATYSINRNQTYIQTLNACTENVNWALPFYGTITTIEITDITNGKNKVVSSTSYMISDEENIITMPKDTKGIFSVSAIGCHTSDTFIFEVNTLAKN